MEQNWEIVVGQASEKIVPAPPIQSVPVQTRSQPGQGGSSRREFSQTDTSWTRFENIETVDVRIHILQIPTKKQIKANLTIIRRLKLLSNLLEGHQERQTCDLIAFLC